MFGLYLYMYTIIFKNLIYFSLTLFLNNRVPVSSSSYSVTKMEIIYVKVSYAKFLFYHY